MTTQELINCAWCGAIGGAAAEIWFRISRAIQRRRDARRDTWQK